MICWIFFRCYGVSEPPAASPARLHKPAGRRRWNEHSAAGGAKGLDIMIYNLQCFFNPPPSNSAFLRRRPRACARRRRPLSCFAAPDIAAQCAGQVPAALRSASAAPGATFGVSLRGPRSPLVSSGGGEPAGRFRLQCLQ